MRLMGGAPRAPGGSPPLGKMRFCRALFHYYQAFAKSLVLALSRSYFNAVNGWSVTRSRWLTARGITARRYSFLRLLCRTQESPFPSSFLQRRGQGNGYKRLCFRRRGRAYPNRCRARLRI